MALNFDAVVVSHKKWKDRIKESIETGKALDWHAVERDGDCELGKWLNGEAARLGALKEFQAAREQHTHFHKVAADTIRKATTLPKDQALALLGMGTPYVLASSSCVTAITALRHKVESN